MPIYVNSTEITDDEVHREMQYHPAGNVDEARHKAAQSLVIRQLLTQAAVERGLLADKEAMDSSSVDDAVDKLLAEEISVPEATEEMCRRYYSANEEKFKDPKTGKLLPFDLVEPHIQHFLTAQSLQTGISQYIKILAGQMKIVGFDLEQSDSPLVR